MHFNLVTYIYHKRVRARANRVYGYAIL